MTDDALLERAVCALERIADAVDRLSPRHAVNHDDSADEWLRALLPELARMPVFTSASAIERELRGGTVQ